uniref:PB1-like domain-containing protein n=1 Tax=Solanum tuberosum TaxID=4113 RepID=M1DBN0_SOLTU
MDVYVTLRFHHGGKLQQKPRIKYEGGIVTDCFDVDVDKLSYFEFVDIVKEIGYNCSACVVYIKPPKCRRVIEVKSDRDIMVKLFNTTFDKESSQPFEGSEGLGFEETAQPEELIVGEELGEVLGRTATSVGEDLGRASAGVGEDLGSSKVNSYRGGSKLGVNIDIPEVGSDWESETEASDDSDNADLSDEGEDEYGSDVHEEVSAIGRGRGTAPGNGTWIGVTADSSGATGRGRGIETGLAGRGRRTSVAATATDVPGATGGGKRPRMVGMEILHTQSGFTIHNPGMPMNSSIVIGNLGHHKPRSGLKWKRKGCCNFNKVFKR